MVAKGRLNTGVRMFANRKFVFEIDIGDVGMDDTIFPTPLMLSQAETEAVMERKLKAISGKTVEWNVSASKISQDEAGVTAVLKKEDGSEEKVRSKYVVGCDGAHSVVRKEAGLKFEGDAYAQDFILADVKLRWEEKDCLTIFMGSYGFMGAFPMKDGIYRLICNRTSSSFADDEPTLKDFEETIKALGPVTGKMEISDPVWVTRFRLHHRIAQNYRAGRLFLAGDAAHIHSPAGGQGMNTGIQDSVNLAWKLAIAIHPSTQPHLNSGTLLDSYNIERHRVGENLLKGTDRLFEFMATKNWFYLWVRNWLVPWIVPWVMKSRERRAERFRFITMLGIRYRGSAVVGEAVGWRGKLRAGDRAPDGKLKGVEGDVTMHDLLKKLKYHLVLFSGVDGGVVGGKELDAVVDDFEKDGNESVKIHKILSTSSTSGSSYVDNDGKVHGSFGMKDSGYALVRPDGHIEFIGQLNAMDELKAWMKK